MLKIAFAVKRPTGVSSARRCTTQEAPRSSRGWTLIPC